MEHRLGRRQARQQLGTNPKVAKQIYDYLNKLGGQVAKFSNALWKTARPLHAGSYNTTNNSFVLTPNPKYGGSAEAEERGRLQHLHQLHGGANAVKSGGLDVMLGFDPSQIPQISSLKSEGIRVFGGPSWGWFAGELNYQNTTGHFDKMIGQLYVRQALQ